MWTCPRCRASFVTRNLSHSCVTMSVREFFASRPKGGVILAKALIKEVRKLGPVKLHPVKTRIALMLKVRFAAIYRFSEESIRGHIWLKERHATNRFERIEKLGRTDYLYHFVVSRDRPIDDELLRFFAMAYAIGRREHAMS